jgi:histidine triad (HIT) family protein
VVIEPPIKKAPIHYVIIPKKDIKNIADISEADTEYIMDAYAVIRDIIQEEGLKEYKVYTNGPGYQSVNYLHFHILAEE